MAYWWPTDGLLMAIHSEDNEQERTKWSALSVKENGWKKEEMKGIWIVHMCRSNNNLKTSLHWFLFNTVPL